MKVNGKVTGVKDVGDLQRVEIELEASQEVSATVASAPPLAPKISVGDEVEVHFTPRSTGPAGIVSKPKP